MRLYGKSGREFYRLADRARAQRRARDTVLILTVFVAVVIFIWEVL